MTAPLRPYAEGVIIFLATLAVLGISASGPIMAATAAPALAIAFWRNMLGSVVMGVPSAIGRRREFRQLNGVGLWLQRAGGGRAGAALCLLYHGAAADLRGGGNRPGLPAVGMDRAFQQASRNQGLPADPVRRRPRLRRGAGDFRVRPAAFRPGAPGRPARPRRWGNGWNLHAGRRPGPAPAVDRAVHHHLLRSVRSDPAGMALAFGQPLVGFSAEAWVGILGVTVVAQLLGHSVFNHLLAVLSPLVVSMFILLEIPGAALLAAIFLGESLPWGTYIGLALILAGLAAVVLSQNRPKLVAPAPAPEATGSAAGLAGYSPPRGTRSWVRAGGPGAAVFAG